MLWPKSLDLFIKIRKIVGGLNNNTELIGHALGFRGTHVMSIAFDVEGTEVHNNRLSENCQTNKKVKTIWKDYVLTTITNYLINAKQKLKVQTESEN